MKMILRVLIMAAAIMALPYVISGISVAGWYPALVAAAVFGLLNLVIKPVIKLITLPINILTLGLFGLVVNGALLWFVASFVDGFAIASFGAAFLGALVLSLVNWLAHLL
ncbi:MAG TPA: phage holin family protein [Candidatus Paceibacterota bacterium]|nr:phage holin family protein [Candidatus Paceibacterota bacterium]